MKRLGLNFLGLLAVVILLSIQVTGYSIRSDTTYNTTALHNVEIHTPSQRVYAAAEFNITFTLDTHDRPLKFALKPNNDLLFQTPHIQFTNTNGGRRTEVLKRNNHRVFKGEVLIQRQSTRWETVGWTRINVLRDGIDPLFNGAFSIAGTQYDVKATANKMLVYYPPDETIDLASNISSSPSIADHYLAPQKRQFTFNSDIFIDSIGDNSGCPSSREIALVGIATDCTYTASFDSSEDLVDAIVSMVNTASEVFENTFNIALALHNLTIEEEECPSTASSDRPWNAGCSAGDLNWRLQAFSEWRGSVRDENAYWTLMSGCSTGSEVGVSWVGELCSEDTATNVVARAQNQWQIFAHESAHTFGAYHDCDASTCSFGRQCCPLSASSCNANGQYLMNPVSTSPQQEFSQCTVGNVCAAMGAGRVRTDCLTTNTNTPTISAGECGNGIVEVGEECDCGDECDGNSCCDGSTCRFIGDAVCDDSAGECCTQCQFASSGTVCRDSVSECDIEETCPGDSGVCPDDEQRPDGETCGNDSDLFCSSGQCTNRDMQCQAQLDNNSSSVSSCGNSTCVLECSTSWSGSGSCSRVGNALDGTPCDDGLCRSGVCRSGSQSDGEESWVQRHLRLVIGLSAGIGGFLLLSLLSCIVYCCCCRRRPKTVAPVSQTPLHPIPGYPLPPPAYSPRPIHPTPYYRYA